jgi:hypothetical protein
MLTVFSVLLLVVLIGNAIILFTNRFFPASKVAAASNSRQGDIDSPGMAAIVAAVKLVTGGKGNVVEINKKQ